MCYVHGSIDQVVAVCPMCKVFPHARCPHQRDICRNRTLHPRIDVSYLKNAEVDSFNGCGYCKWARTGPPPKQAGFFNPGWPGCCRPPTVNEYKLIQPADWKSVSIVHQVPIPHEVKAALESLGNRGSPVLASPSGGRIAGGVKTTSTDRRSSSNSSPSRSPSTTGKTSFSISGKPRSGSPKQIHTSLNSSLSRSSSATAISSSVPTASTMDQMHQRRQSGERRLEGSHSSHSSPKRKNVDLEASLTPKRNSSTKVASLTPSTTSVSLSKVVVGGKSQGSPTSDRHRASSVSTSNPLPSKFMPPPKPVERPVSFVIPRSTKKDEDQSSASSSSGSSDGVGSMTDSTVTSDGGFTDYLSDESEAELQRQAEAKAALVAQNQAEELEFKAARQQLAHVDLRPPKSWNPTNITNNTTSRLPGGAGAAYPPRSAPMPMAHAAQTRI